MFTEIFLQVSTCNIGLWIRRFGGMKTECFLQSAQGMTKWHAKNLGVTKYWDCWPVIIFLRAKILWYSFKLVSLWIGSTYRAKLALQLWSPFSGISFSSSFNLLYNKKEQSKESPICTTHLGPATSGKPRAQLNSLQRLHRLEILDTHWLMVLCLFL